MLSVIGLAFGGMLLVVAVSPTEPVALVAVVFMGLCSISFIATANATILLQADPARSGRVMSLYAIAFLGSTPIGAPFVGWVAAVSNPRVPIVAGGLATLSASLPLAVRYLNMRTSRSTLPVSLEVPDAEPGEVVDFAPQARRERRPEETKSPMRHVGGL
jgi:MFS family permease